MSKSIGCIGCGNMGGAIMAGLADKLAGTRYDFCGYNRTSERMRPWRKKACSQKPVRLKRRTAPKC